MKSEVQAFGCLGCFGFALISFYLVWGLFLLSFVAKYSSLECKRINPTQGDCYLTKISPSHYKRLHFPIRELKGTSQQKRKRTGSETGTVVRLAIEIPSQKIPFTRYSDSVKNGYTHIGGQVQDYQQTEVRIQEFANNLDSESLIVEQWPSGWQLILVIVLILSPLLQLFRFIPALRAFLTLLQ